LIHALGIPIVGAIPLFMIGVMPLRAVMQLSPRTHFVSFAQAIL